MLSGQVTGPLLRLVNLWQEFQQVGISVQRLGDVLNTSRSPLIIRTVRPPQVAGQIAFDDVTFRYRPDGPEVLHQVSLTIQPGQVIGHGGAVRVRQKHDRQTDSASVCPGTRPSLVDGVDLAQVDPAWLRRQVGVVLQENFLFQRSVRDNIALDRSGAVDGPRHPGGQAGRRPRIHS